jgi:predicted lipid-binding transport protein (Tim44 family)
MARSKSSDSPDTPDKPKKASRTAQIRQAYSMTRKSDPRIGLIVFGAFLGAFAVMLLLGLLLGHPIYLGVMGVMFGVLAATIVFGKRAEKAAFAQVEGQPGAAAAALNMLRKGWTVTPGVAVNRNQDLVHRAVGRPGVVLIAEGGGQSRLGNLLAQEKKKVARFVPDVPIYDIQAGNDEGQVPLRKLNKHLMKLPRNLKNDQVGEVNRRLKALGTMNLPIPKGPMPRNIPRGGPRG